jgi:hypothetical protein
MTPPPPARKKIPRAGRFSFRVIAQARHAPLPARHDSCQRDRWDARKQLAGFAVARYAGQRDKEVRWKPNDRN